MSGGLALIRLKAADVQYFLLQEKAVPGINARQKRSETLWVFWGINLGLIRAKWVSCQGD